MDRREAATLLGIPLTSTRQEARTAYLRLLSGAAGADSVELDAAYAAFTGDGVANGVGGGAAPGPSPSAMTQAPERSRRSILPVVALAWGVVAIGLILAGLAIAANNGSGSVSTATASPLQKPPNTPPPSEPNQGQSGLLNTCWKDSGVATPDGSIPLTQVECTWATADWLAYRETTNEQGCALNDYIQTPEGWYLCLRSR